MVLYMYAYMPEMFTNTIPLRKKCKLIRENKQSDRLHVLSGKNSLKPLKTKHILILKTTETLSTVRATYLNIT